MMLTSTNGRWISTHEATVKTAAVEVKTLTINGKLVTLAVFRQLRNVPPMGLDEAWSDLEDAVYHWRNFQALWAKHYEALLGLDQFFIAV